MSALPPKADIAFEARWLWALITRYLFGKRKVLRRRIAFNFSPNCFVAATCRIPSTASFGLTQLRMIRKYGGAHGQGDVEIGAHSKNR